MANIDDKLKTLTASDVDAKKKQKVYEELMSDTAPKQSLVGAGLGGLGGGLAALIAGYPLGRLAGRMVQKPIVDKLEDLAQKKLGGDLSKVGSGMEEGGKKIQELYAASRPGAPGREAHMDMTGLKEGSFGANAVDMLSSIANWSARNSEKIGSELKTGRPGANKIVQDVGGIGTGFIGGNVGALVGANYGGDLMADRSNVNPDAEAALKRLMAGGMDPEEQRNLLNAYASHYNQLQDQKGSGLAAALVNLGISVPLGLKFHSGGVANFGRRIIPDKFLEKNPWAGSKFARDLLTETAGDVIVASPFGAVGGTLAYNLTSGNDYENPFG